MEIVKLLLSLFALNIISMLVNIWLLIIYPVVLIYSIFISGKDFINLVLTFQENIPSVKGWKENN